MAPRPGGDRRAPAARPHALRRLAARVSAELYRPLAGDDDRVAYLLRHVRLGIVLSETSAIGVAGYTLFTTSPGRHSVVLLTLAAIVVVGSPALLLLPLAAMMRDRRGPVLFYGWSAGVTLVVTIGSRLDGGASSPLFALLFLALAFAAVAYPPAGVVLMGGIMTGSYLFLVAGPRISTFAAFVAVVMGGFTMICATASANQWAAYDRQTMLLRTHEILAATDPLTGCLNRRAFLDRLATAIAAAGAGHQSVVCLVDLDGFKGVNDREGHAAGDAVLRAVTTALAGAVRETDTVARLGGDEFAVLAAVTGPRDGELLAGRLRAGVERVGWTRGVTGSVGMTPVGPGDDQHDLLHRADSAMYRAKAAGGNRVTALAR